MSLEEPIVKNNNFFFKMATTNTLLKQLFHHFIQMMFRKSRFCRNKNKDKLRSSVVKNTGTDSCGKNTFEAVKT